MLGTCSLLRGRSFQQIRYSSSGRPSRVGRIALGALGAIGLTSTAAIYFLDIPIGESIDSVLPKEWQIFHKHTPAISRPHVILPLEPRPHKPLDVPTKDNDDKSKEDKKPIVNKDKPIVNVKKDLKKKPEPVLEPTLQEREESVKAALVSAEKSVKNATQSKALSIDLIDDHVRTLRSAISEGVNGNWDEVRRCNESVINARNEDLAAERDARNYVDSLRQIAESTDKVLPDHPIVQSAINTATKMEKELDEMAYSVKMIESEQIFALEYADLVQTARGRFADEMKAVVPSFEWNGEEKMKKKQLNALLVHAHLKLDILRRELIEMQVRDATRIQEALKAEMAKRNELMKEEREAAFNIEEELRHRLDQLECEHAARLEVMVRAQRELARMEKDEAVEEAVTVERQTWTHKFASCLGRLEGIEEGLKRRAVLDAENRRAKQTWLACHELEGAIEYGRAGAMEREGRRRPIGKELKTLLQVSEGDPFVSQVVNAVSEKAKEKGEYTRADMETRFHKVHKVGTRVAYIGGTETNGIMSYVGSWIQSLITFSFPLNGKEKRDWTTVENMVLLDTAKRLVKEKKWMEAARVLSLLEGESRRVASDWEKDLRSLEESLFLVRLLRSHAALQSVRSTY